MPRQAARADPLDDLTSMKRSNFDLPAPVSMGPLSFPERPALHGSLDGRFAYSGRRAYVTGSSDEPRVRAGLTPGFELGLAASPEVSEVHQLRTSLRRVLPNGIVEQCLVPLDLAVVLWQWEIPEPRIPLVLDLEISVAGTGCAWNHDSRTLEVRCSNGNNLSLIFSDPVDWEISSDEHTNRLRLRATIAPESNTSIRCAALAAIDETERLRALNRLQNPQPLLNARRTATLQQDMEQPGFETPERALNDVLVWSTHIARNSVIETFDSGRTVLPGCDAAAMGLSLLALGDHAGARGILQHFGTSELPAAQLPMYLLLAARYVAWTADFDFIYSQWPQIVAFADRCIADEFTRDPFVLLVLRELADAAASLGDETARARFISFATHDPTRIEEEGIRRNELAVVFADRSAERIANFRRVVEQASPYTFASFVYGLVGIQPDAPKNRIRVAPAVPSDWDSFELTSIALGDARIDLRYRRDADRHTFRIAQSAGAIPVRAVFEPLVAGARVEQILLDGQPAQLDILREPGGVTTPVQLDLDYERVLEIVIGG